VIVLECFHSKGIVGTCGSLNYPERRPCRRRPYVLRLLLNGRTLATRFLHELPQRLIAVKAYDSDRLGQSLWPARTPSS
jgi:hypothetical protein